MQRQQPKGADINKQPHRLSSRRPEKRSRGQQLFSVYMCATHSLQISVASKINYQIVFLNIGFQCLQLKIQLICLSINDCCSWLTTIAMGHEMSEAEEEIARNYADEDAV